MMVQKSMLSQSGESSRSVWAARAGLGEGAVLVGDGPEFAVRLVGALLALAVTTVHVADQGGITAFAAPNWIGWGYRLIEVGGVVTAVALIMPRTGRAAWLGPLSWAAGVLLGVGPLVGYIASRTVGVPGDPGDVGNWGYWVGTVSLLVEAALIVLSAGMFMAIRQRSTMVALLAAAA